MRLLRLCLLAALTLTCAARAMAEDLPTLRIATLKFGTVNWELDTIRRNGFDAAAGFQLETLGLAGGAAAKIAFQGGAADVLVTDWLWVARQRAEGRDYVFLPYSRAVGGLAVPANSPARSLADLKGASIGVAGGPLDKSWLILRAHAEKTFDFDLVKQTEQVFGAPPLLSEKAKRGELDAVLSYWHYLARLEAEGFRIIAPVNKAAEALGLDPETPLLGYVMKADFAGDHPDLVQGLAQASRNAKALLAGDDTAWEPLRPMMKADTDAAFERLREGFRAGIPADAPVNLPAAERLFALMRDLGGSALVGRAETLPEGVFLDLGE